jgi:hypothetical protein
MIVVPYPNLLDERLSYVQTALDTALDSGCGSTYQALDTALDSGCGSTYQVPGTRYRTTTVG